jgi:L-asparaginase type I
MRKVIVLTTGGTIGHRSGSNGVAVLDFDPERLSAEIGRPDVDIEFKAILRKGSMDIDPGDWQTIASAVAEAVMQQPQGIVILHGTDTMSYTASALAFMLGGLSIPVVMTGSMIPGGDAGSDAIVNLRDAVTVAATANFAEVCVVFSADAERSRGIIIRGCRARKVHSYAINAFASINVPPIGFVKGHDIIQSGLETKLRNSSELKLATALDWNAVLVKLTPNMTPPVLARLLQGSSGAVLEGTGIGHIKTDLQSVVADYGKPAVVSTQSVYGGERLGPYEADRHILAIPNIIPAGDMSSETALVKLMWALGQGGDTRAIMQANIAGEIASGPWPAG